MRSFYRLVIRSICKFLENIFTFHYGLLDSKNKQVHLKFYITKQFAAKCVLLFIYYTYYFYCWVHPKILNDVLWSVVPLEIIFVKLFSIVILRVLQHGGGFFKLAKHKTYFLV